MSLGQRVSSDHQRRTRLLQIGVVLEELVESRAPTTSSPCPQERAEFDEEVDEGAAEAAESADHRERATPRR